MGFGKWARSFCGGVGSGAGGSRGGSSRWSVVVPVRSSEGNHVASVQREDLVASVPSSLGKWRRFGREWLRGWHRFRKCLLFFQVASIQRFRLARVWLRSTRKTAIRGSHGVPRHRARGMVASVREMPNESRWLRFREEEPVVPVWRRFQECNVCGFGFTLPRKCKWRSFSCGGGSR